MSERVFKSCSSVTRMNRELTPIFPSMRVLCYYCLCSSDCNSLWLCNYCCIGLQLFLLEGTSDSRVGRGTKAETVNVGRRRREVETMNHTL